jgi:hypothetical protein
MSLNLTTHDIIVSALQLPFAAREEVIVALQESLVDATVDHGPAEPAEAVETAWGDEIARRIEDIDSGRVKTIPSEEAWKFINGKTPPTL